MFSLKSDWKEKFLLNVFWGIVLAILFNIIVKYTDIGNTVLNSVYDYLVVNDFEKSLKSVENSKEPPIDEHIQLVLFDKEIYESSDSKGFWTPRDLVGESVLKAVNLGAKVVVADFEWNRPAPVFSKEKDENQRFLKLMEDAAKTARNKKADIIMPHTEIDQDKGDYKQKFDKLMKDYQDVIKQGIPAAFEDARDYQVRHFRFYERTEQNYIFFSLQILAATYLWHDLEEGNKIITETENNINNIHPGLKKIEIKMKTKTGKPIHISPQNDPNKEYLDARYLFRIAQRDIITGYEDPCIKYADMNLCLSPYELLDKTGDIYKEKIVIIGSTYPEIGDIHLTPVGKMHGVFLIANGINLFLEGIQIHELGKSVRIIIEIIGILIAAALFTLFHSSIATFLMTGVYVTIAVIISPRLFSQYGILTDFWFPIIAVFISRFISDTDEFVLGYLNKLSFFKKRP